MLFFILNRVVIGFRSLPTLDCQLVDLSYFQKDIRYSVGVFKSDLAVPMSDPTAAHVV